MDFSLFQDLFAERIGDWFGLNPEYAIAAAATLSVALIVVIAIVIERSFRKLINWLVPKLVERFGSETPRKWETALGKRLVASRSAHIIGTLVFYWLIPFALQDYPEPLRFFLNVVEGYLVLILVISVNSILQASKDVWDDASLGVGVPIRFATQALQILVWIVGLIVAISVTMDQSVTVLLSGMAGMTAILALVFKDSLLGFVAGIQLAGNEMLRTGDWIEVPQYGANGTVVEIGLTTVKVQNFDKTISTVPSYALVNESFKNWRGMWDFDARRIKRTIRLDIYRIRFLSEDDLAGLSSEPILGQFWAEQHKRIPVNSLDPDKSGKGTRQPTNLSLFGDYLRHYLGRHPDICPDKLMMVRQLESDAQGLPIEIYCFCSDINWTHYEDIQWKIMDHVLAVLPIFGLRVFQLPTSLPSIAPREPHA